MFLQYTTKYYFQAFLQSTAKALFLCIKGGQDNENRGQE